MSDETKPTFNKYVLEARKTGIKLAEEMSQAANGSYSKAFVEGFVIQMLFNTHRVLQQEMFICFIEAIQEAAEQYKKDNYDPRCEATYKWCAEVCEKVDMWPFVRIIKK